MARSLSAPLAAAQESKEDRHPIVQIVSDQWTAAIPFDGTYFDDSVSGEHYPGLLAHSSGALCGVYTRDWLSSESQFLHFIYSDTDRALWTDVEIYNAGARAIAGASLVELANEDIGIVFQRNEDLSTGTTYLSQMIVNITGETVAAASDIASYDESIYWISAPCVVNFSGEHFFLTYAHASIQANMNSGEHHLHARTASTFGSWSAASEMVISGELREDHKIDNPFVLAPTTGDMIVFYDYVDDTTGYRYPCPNLDSNNNIKNVYYSTSSDNGLTWTSGELLTDNTDFGFLSENPTAAVHSSGDIRLAYHDKSSVKTMDMATSGWCSSSQGAAVAFCATRVSPTHMHFDTANRKLMCLCKGNFSPVICSLLVIDVDTWTIDDCYSDSSSPSFNEVFSDKVSTLHMNRHSSSGKYITGSTTGTNLASFVYNNETEEFTEFFFENFTSYGAYKNVEVDFRAKSAFVTLVATYMDAPSGRFYHLFVYPGYSVSHYWMGYINLNNPINPETEMYDFVEINYWQKSTYDDPEEEDYKYDQEATARGINAFVVIPGINAFVISSSNTSGYDWAPRTIVYSLSSGAEIANFWNRDNSAFPHQGVTHPIYCDGNLYCAFPYKSTYGQADRRGMVRINLASGGCTYLTPPYGSGLDDYGLGMNTLTDDNRIIWNTDSYGIWIYNPSDGSWTGYNNELVPGFTPDESDSMHDGDVAYDSVNKTVFASRYYYYADSWQGLLAFSELGAYKQMQYVDAEWTTSWQFGTPAALTLYSLDYDGAIAYDEEDVCWLFWTRLDGTEESLKWDSTGVTKDVSQYLVGDVEAEWAIDQPNKLTFSCSHGHLFDPSNQFSTWALYFKRGRKVTLKFGERISGVNYWENQGTYIVEEASLSYKRGEYPIISVTAMDVRNVWSEGTITATEHYDDAHPEYILQQLLEDHGKLSSSQYILPADGAMENSHKIYHQFIDQNLMDMIQEICDHFGYSHYFNMDGKFTINYMDFDASVDHYYGDNTKLISFTPSAAYGSYINRVVIKGEGRYFVEVLFNEERVHTETGTTGWWGVTEVKRHYYDSDEKRSCKNARLVDIESPKISLLFVKKGGGSIKITNEDINETWVEVTIKAPDLIFELFATTVTIISLAISASGCDVSKSCGAYIYGLGFATQAAALILGSVANYKYDIWAQPVGHEKQMFQATANDLDLQTELNGMIIAQEFQDPFCYDLNACQIVADQEIRTLQGQRKRVSFTKLAHLQDEIGDVIEVPHPNSHVRARYLIASLTRRFRKSERDSSDGLFEDIIEGWKVI